MSINRTFFVPHPPIIIPEIGKGEEEKIQKTINVYHEIAREIGKIKPDTIIISSPHSTMYADYFHISPGKHALGNFDKFRCYNISYEVHYDKELVDKLSSYAKKNKISAGTFGEKDKTLDHATLVPLYFINQYYTDYKLVRISPSGLPLVEHYNLGKTINSIIPENKKVVWVASGDLSHKLTEKGPYGFAKEGIEFDNLIVSITQTGEFKELLQISPNLRHKAAECGLGSLTMMTGVFDGYDVKPNLLSYEGPFGVGYCVASFERQEINDKRKFGITYINEIKSNIIEARKKEDEYVELARMSLEYYIRNKKELSLPKELSSDIISKKAGVFVSLHKDGSLRGCIGTISPITSSIAKEIIQNAISSGTRDPRFSPVEEKELSKIEYSVDIILSPEPIQFESQLNVYKYGVIVKSGFKSGLLLPNIEGIDSVEEQVLIAKRKAGINEYESFTLERFEVVRHF